MGFKYGDWAGLPSWGLGPGTLCSLRVRQFSTKVVNVYNHNCQLSQPHLLIYFLKKGLFSIFGSSPLTFVLFQVFHWTWASDNFNKNWKKLVSWNFCPVVWSHLFQMMDVLIGNEARLHLPSSSSSFIIKLFFFILFFIDNFCFLLLVSSFYDVVNQSAPTRGHASMLEESATTELRSHDIGK